MANVSLTYAVEKFLAYLRMRVTQATIDLHRLYLSRFTKEIGERPIDSITRIDVEMFSCRKHPLSTLRRFFRWAKDIAEWISKDPTEHVDVPKSGRRSRVLSRWERVALRRYARPSLRALLLALENTGARPEEIRRVTWGDIRSVDPCLPLTSALRFGKAYFELAGFKAMNRMKGSPPKRTIPISPRLGRYLARKLTRSTKNEYAGENRSNPVGLDRVFCSPSGSEWSGNAVRLAFRRVRARAENRTGKSFSGLVPYLYRHTLATTLAKRGVNGRILADFLGHRSLEMLSWYVHPSVSDLCRLLENRNDQ